MICLSQVNIPISFNLIITNGGFESAESTFAMNTSRQFISRASVWQIRNKLLHDTIFVDVEFAWQPKVANVYTSLNSLSKRFVVCTNTVVMLGQAYDCHI